VRKIKIVGDGTVAGTKVMDETGELLPVVNLKLEVDAREGWVKAWIRLYVDQIEIEGVEAEEMNG